MRHLFIEKSDYNGAFLPGFQPWNPDFRAAPCGWKHIDHMVFNVDWNDMDRWADWYKNDGPFPNNEISLFVYQDGMIAGRRVIETTHAAAGTCYFGLFENVMIGTFGGVDIVVDPYTNGSTGIVNIYAYQLCDVGVLRPNAFQKVTLTT